MEHRGVEYRIIQGIKRGLWKWSVETETGTKSGTSALVGAGDPDVAVPRVPDVVNQPEHPRKIGGGR